MIETRIVQKFGNSAHIVLPKEYIGKRIKFTTKTKTFSQIKLEIIKIITPCLENVLAVYIYGSYARNEETLDSDVDILIVTDKEVKISDEEYKIISITEAQIIKTLEKDAILILPIIRESIPIINSQLLERYKDYKFTRENTKEFLEACERIIKINKQSLELNLGIGAMIYSLILRVRGLLILDLFLRNNSYSKANLFNYLEKEISKEKVIELYSIYTKVRNKGVNIENSEIIKKEDIKMLINIAEKLIKKLKEHKWERKDTKKE